MRATIDESEIFRRFLELDIPFHLGGEEQILEELFEEGEEGVVGEDAVDPLRNRNPQFALRLLLEFDCLLAAAAVGPALPRLYCSWSFFQHCEIFQLHADRIHSLLGIDQGEHLLVGGAI
jgi:hypothetical protein